MTFLEGYRSFAVPRLRRMCDTEGAAVWAGDAGFPEAHAAVMHEAIRLGAARLPEPKRWQLSQWISNRIVQAAQAFDTLPEPDAFEWDWC